MGSNINSLSMALVRAIMVDMEQLHKQVCVCVCVCARACVRACVCT